MKLEDKKESMLKPQISEAEIKKRLAEGSGRPLADILRDLKIDQKCPFLTLLVLRSQQMENLLAFYRVLGLVFAEEQHGNGPIHHAAKCGDMVFELYPASEDRQIDSATRLGFAVGNVDGVIVELQKLGAPIVTPPQQTDWGYRAVVRDPDGRAIELTQ